MLESPLVVLLGKWFVVTAVFLVSAAVTPKVRVGSWVKAVLAAVVFGLVALLLGWLLKLVFGALLFLPAILTFGLGFLLVPVLVNMVLLWLTDALMGDGLRIQGLWTKLVMAVALSVAFALLFH
ncbi:MAG TPA: phage holin family protein [Myxococcota bacterium]|nr:phage holin family protein [Myxococcota bacterium]HRY93058.1 phage holin family protein [Myxococcota bacterium]HSA21564.1 phage holin family protein [Myxococcota bacterium]